QIFKARLITEMELKQRVVERSLLEERLGHYLEELQKAKDKEQAANDAFAAADNKLHEQLPQISNAFSEILAQVDVIRTDNARSISWLDNLADQAGRTPTLINLAVPGLTRQSQWRSLSLNPRTGLQNQADTTAWNYVDSLYWNFESFVFFHELRTAHDEFKK